MKLFQTGSREYDKRLERAEVLSRKQPFAAEILKFYSEIARFQKSLHARIAVDSSAPGGAPAGAKLREKLDLAVVLPHFRGFLQLTERNAPKPLAEAARKLALEPADSWTAVLTGYWKNAGRGEEPFEAFRQFLPRAFLQPYAEFLGEEMDQPALLVTAMVCPRCAGLPLLGVLRREGDSGKRFLMCSLCLQEWEFRRILCPACGEEVEGKLPVYVADQFPHIRVEACDTCRIYLLTIDLTRDGHAVPIVDDLAALPLTLWASEHGYSRLQPNLLGT
jgi:FdhE protein